MNAFLIFAALAQTQTITLHDAVKAAQTIHPAVAFAIANAERGRHITREIQATRLPLLSLESSATGFKEPMVVAPLHGLNPEDRPVFDRALAQGSLALGYTVFDASRGDRIGRAKALADAAGAQVDAARTQVMSETVRAYLRVQSTREVTAAQDKQVEALRRERDRARQLVEQGRAARVVLLRAEAALSAASADAVTAQSEFDDALHELARLIDQPASALAATNFPAVRARSAARLTRDELLQAAVAMSPELRRLRLQQRAADAEKGVAKGAWWPRVQLGARFIEYASSSTSPQGEWQGGAQLSYPIYTGGARSAAADRALAEARAADAELAWGSRRVAESLDRALTALSAATARVTALNAAVAQSEEVTRIDQLALQSGAGVQTDYLAAEAALFRARAALTEARAAEVMARVELARVTGILTTDWLATELENIP
jgi:outer membrane protein TolC